MIRNLTKRASRVSALFLAVALGASACSSGADAGAGADSSPVTYSPDEQALYDAAKAEPALTWYSAQVPELNDATLKDFQARYPGLNVTVQRLSSNDLATRYSAERTAGTVPAGLMTVGTPEFFPQALAKGWFEKTLDLPALADWPKAAYSNGVAKVGITTYSISWNTDLIDEEQAPKSWEDLTNPAFQGKMGFGDPRTVPGYLALVYILREKYGDDYIRALGRQNLILSPSAVPGNQDLASGSISLLIPNAHLVADALKNQGAPIELMTPDLTTGSENFTAVSTKTSSPQAARLLMNFLLTEEGQADFNGSGGSSVLGAVGDTIPLPAGYVAPPQTEANAQRAELLALLGIKP
jgi:iron(III) transport system substrate-binding protein